MAEMMAAKMMDLREPITGIEFPGRMNFYGLSMLNLGCGANNSQKSSIGGKTTKYALGFYVENNDRAREVLRPWMNSTPSSGFAEVILAPDPSTFFAKAVHLVLARQSSRSQILGKALNRLQQVLSASAFAQFRCVLQIAIGKAGLPKGAALTFLWVEPALMRVFINGKVFDEEITEGPRQLFSILCFGANPVVPELLTSMTQNLSRLFDSDSPSRGFMNEGPGLRFEFLDCDLIQHETSPAEEEKMKEVAAAFMGSTGSSVKKILSLTSEAGTLARARVKEKAMKYLLRADELTPGMLREIQELSVLEIEEGLDPSWIFAYQTYLRVAIRIMENTLRFRAVARGDGCASLPWPLRPCGGWLRMKAYQTIKHPAFDQAIMVCIVANCIFLALADPTAATVPTYQVVAEFAFLYIFSAEVVAKVLALGTHYLDDPWNWLDAVVVVEGWLSSILTQGSIVSGLKTLRILRPLRMANRLPSVKNTVGALVGSIPAILDIFIVFYSFVGVMALLCVDLWSGTFRYRCQDESTGLWVDEEQLCYPKPDGDSDKLCNALLAAEDPYDCEAGQSCVGYGSSPMDDYVKFDNFLWSFLNLFVTSTLEGWSSILFYSQDVTGGVSLWIFVVFIVLGNFTIINLMIATILVQLGFVVDVEEEIKIEREILTWKNNEEKATVRKARMLAIKSGSAVPPIPLGERLCECTESTVAACFKASSGMLRSICYDGLRRTASRRPRPMDTRSRLRRFVTDDSSSFSYAIQICIVVNVVALAMDSYGIDETTAYVLELINITLTSVFAGEMTVKIIVIGVIDYVRDSWNIFDALIVAGSLLEVLLVSGSSSLGVLRVVRALRLARVGRLIKLIHKWQSIEKVFIRIGSSLKKMLPILLLLVLFLFICTILGMQLFGEEITTDETIRFDNFYVAFVQVFYLTLGEQWSNIMYSTMPAAGPSIAVFCVLIVMIGGWVLLNLILAVLLSGSLPSKTSKGLMGWQILSEVESKYELKTAFEKWSWYSTQTQIRCAQIAALLAWRGAARVYGQKKFKMLARELGLDGDLKRALESTVEIGSWISRDDIDHATLEQQRLGIPMPFEKFETQSNHKLVSPKDQRSSHSSSNQAVKHQANFVARDIKSLCTSSTNSHGEVGYHKDVLIWRLLLRAASVVARFAELHIPKNHDLRWNLAAGTGIDGEIALINQSSQEQSELTAQGIIDARNIFGLLREPIQDTDMKPELFKIEDHSPSILIRFSRPSILDSSYDSIRTSEGCHACFKRIAFKVIRNKIWVGLISVALLAACAIEFALEKNSAYNSVEFTLFAICAVLFVAEIPLVFVTSTPASSDLEITLTLKAYLMNGWNVLDLLVAIGSLLWPLFRETGNDSLVFWCLIAKGFRPLRLLRSHEGLLHQINIIFNALAALSTLGLFLLFSMTAWAVVGMQVLKGLYYRCDDGDWAENADYMANIGAFPANSPRYGAMNDDGLYVSRPCSGNYTNSTGFSLEAKGEWVNAEFHFDDFFNSLLSVFIMAVGGWGNIVLDGLSATEIGYSPAPYLSPNPIIIIYFFVGVTFFGLYVINEFVGVVFDAYVKDKMKSEDAFHELNLQERKVLELKHRIDGAVPYPFVALPRFLPRRMLHSLVTSFFFTFFIYLVIFLNAITLAATHFNQPDSLTTLIDFADLIFAAVFAVEVILKLGAFGFHLYFREMGNTFDFIISAVCCFDSALVLLDQCTSRSSLRSFLRSMRVFRLLRLLNLIRGCEVIALTMNFAKVHLITVFAILCILILFFANISVVLFDGFPEISRHSSFQDERSAAQLFFILMTGDDWTGTMGSMLDYDESMKGVVTVFFLTFMVSVTFIMVNLFIMVVCESFEVLSNETKKRVELSLPLFKEAWAFFDKNASGFAHEDKLEDLLKRIPEPFGVTIPLFYDTQVTTARRQLLLQKLSFLRHNLTPNKDGYMNFHEVMFLLVAYHTIEIGELKSRIFVRSMMKLKAKIVIESELRAWVNRHRATKHERKSKPTNGKLAPDEGPGVNAVFVLEEKEEHASSDYYEKLDLSRGSIELTSIDSNHSPQMGDKAAGNTSRQPVDLNAAKATDAFSGNEVIQEEVVPVSIPEAVLPLGAEGKSGVIFTSPVEIPRLDKQSLVAETSGGTHAAESKSGENASRIPAPTLPPKLEKLSDILIRNGLQECAAAFEEEEFDTALFMELINDESDLEDMPTIELSSRRKLVALASSLRRDPPLENEFVKVNDQIRASGHDGGHDAGRSTVLTPTFHRESASADVSTSLSGAALPRQCVVRNYGHLSHAACVSQNERWSWFFGWGSSAAHMELGDPPYLSTEDFSVEVPSEGLGEVLADGPPANSWDAPQGYAWVHGTTWSLIDQSKPPHAKPARSEGNGTITSDEGYQKWFYAPDVASLMVQSGSTTTEFNSAVRRCVWMRPLEPQQATTSPTKTQESNVAAVQHLLPRSLAVKELGSFLSSAGLGLLLKPLVDAGYDSVDKLAAACADSNTRTALELLGLKKLHITKIQQTLEGSSSAPPSLPSYAIPTSTNIKMRASASHPSSAGIPTLQAAL